MKITKAPFLFISIILIFLFLGCTIHLDSNTQKNQINTPENDPTNNQQIKDNDNPQEDQINTPENDPTNNQQIKDNDGVGEGVFCKMPNEFKFAFDEKYYLDGSETNPGIVTKRFFKKTNDSYSVYNRESNIQEGFGNWTIVSRSEYLVYDYYGNTCIASRMNPEEISSFLDEEIIYFEDQFTGESKEIGGSEIGWKLKLEDSLEITSIQNNTTIADYISKEYCFPLTQDVNLPFGKLYSEKINFTRDFSDNVFDLPIDCNDVIIQDHFTNNN